MDFCLYHLPEVGHMTSQMHAMDSVGEEATECVAYRACHSDKGKYSL